MKKFFLFTCISLGFVASLFAQPQWQNGGDTYGYLSEVFDGTDPRYSWVDIESPNNEVFGLADDNFVGPYEIGFDFPFYWYTDSTYYIGSNGFIALGGNGFNIASTMIGFPTTGGGGDETNNLLAPFMCDLSFAGNGNTGRCYRYSSNDSLVISYINVPFWTNNAVGYAGSNSFQVILNAADSTIKFQYLQQQGVWNASYDMSQNPMMVGIENVTGNIGIRVANNIYPTEMTGVIFKAPANSPLSIQDGTPISVENPETGGFFLPWPGNPYTFSTRIGNLGNADFTLPTTVRARALDTLGQTFFQVQTTVGPLAAGQREDITLPVPFNPPLPGPYNLTVTTDTTSEEDNVTNNRKVVEAVATDTTGGTATLQFVSDNRNNIDGSVLWTSGGGNSGIGVYYEPTGYPVKITAIDVFVIPNNNADTLADGGFWVGLYDDDPIFGLIPGAPLFIDTVAKEDVDILDNATNFLGTWNRVTLPQPVEITEGGFYASWFHLNDSILLSSESVAPISRRSYEILGGTWAPHRSNATEDYYIRVITDVSEVDRGVGIEDELQLSKFMVYPNPNEGNMKLELELKRPTDLQLSVHNLQGVKVFRSVERNVSKLERSLDLPNLPAGVYFIKVSGKDGLLATEKVIIK
jgi:hypothetical protein